MKKCIAIIATALITAGYASAVDIQWGSGAFTAVDGANNPLTSGTAYLVYIGTDPYGVNASWNGTSWDMHGDVVVQSAAINAYGTFYNTFSSIAAPYATAGAQYAIFVTTDGVAGTVLPTSGFYGEVISTSWTLPAQDPATTESFGPTANMAAVEPIPEPTSMALIGIGAAVVALRKRFGKKA